MGMREVLATCVQPIALHQRRKIARLPTPSLVRNESADSVLSSSGVRRTRAASVGSPSSRVRSINATARLLPPNSRARAPCSPGGSGGSR